MDAQFTREYSPAPPWQSDPVAGCPQESEFRLVVISGSSLEEVHSLMNKARRDGFELVRIVPVEYACSTTSGSCEERLGILLRRNVL